MSFEFDDAPMQNARVRRTRDDGGVRVHASAEDAAEDAASICINILEHAVCAVW